MANKKNFWYVIVMTDYGPVFVTSVDYKSKEAHWDISKKPKEVGMYSARDLVVGLNLNGHLAYAICNPIELDSQPYNYEHYQIEWKEKSDEDQSED